MAEDCFGWAVGQQSVGHPVHRAVAANRDHDWPLLLPRSGGERHLVTSMLGQPNLGVPVVCPDRALQARFEVPRAPPASGRVEDYEGVFVGKQSAFSGQQRREGRRKTALEILRFARDDTPTSPASAPLPPLPPLPPQSWRERVGIEPTGAATGASQRF